MAYTSITQDTEGRKKLKSYFQRGDTPTEDNFAELIDLLATVSELKSEEALRASADNDLQNQINVRDQRISALNSLTGMPSGATKLGSFTGGIISDQSDIYTALQAIETYIEETRSQLQSNDTDIADLRTDITNLSTHSSRIASLEANIGLDSFTFACSAETGNISTGTVCTFRMPYDYSLVDVRGALTSASSSGNTSFTVAVNGSNVTNQIDLGVGAKTTYSAGAASSLVGINSSPIGITMDSEITVNVSSAGTGASGLKVTLVGSLGATTITSSDGNITFPITFPYGTTLTTIS